MKIGKVDLQNFEYMIVYQDDDGSVNTWTLPEGSFQMNYKSMIKRGVKVLRVFRQMTKDDLLDALIRE